MPDIDLTPINRSHAEAFMTWASDPVVTAPLFWDAYSSKDAVTEFLIQVAEKHPWFMAIAAFGEVVGAITLDQGAGKASCRAELGYVIARAHWGRGVATAAVKLALQRGFADLGLARIEALVDPDNLASVRVLEKAGFVLEGELRNYLVHRGRIRDRRLYAVVP